MVLMSWTWPWERRSISIICKNSSELNSWLNTLEPKTKSNIEKEIKVFDSNKDSYITTEELQEFVLNSRIFYSDGNIWLKNKLLDTLDKNLYELWHSYDVVVSGDTVAATFATLAAAREGKRVLLVRSSGGRMGGVLTKGNLAYLDRNQKSLDSNHQALSSTGIWKEFLQRAGVEDKQISLDPNKAHEALRQMLAEEKNVHLISNTKITGFKKENNQITSLKLTKGQRSEEVKTGFVIEADNLQLAELLGLKTVTGVPEIGEQNKTLSVSPVFSVKYISVKEIQELEHRILNNPELLAEIKAKVRKDWPEKAEEIIRDFSKITHLPKGADYADMQSYLLCICFCLRTNKIFHPSQRVFPDKWNIAVRPNGILSCNGALLFNLSNEEIAELEKNGKKPTDEMKKEIKLFEEFFFKEFDCYGTFIPPEEVYIRHSKSIAPSEVVDPVTLDEVKKGLAGCEFAYKADYRGLIPASEENYCIGFDNTNAHLVKSINNFALVGPRAAFPVGFARLEEFNASSAFNLAKKVAREIS